MMGSLKNHRDERVTVSVEELVPQDHFLRTIEATINFVIKKSPRRARNGFCRRISSTRPFSSYN
ncbi:hypothetical protein [Bacillus gaemokensis]|uniref:hypothetical protein n=1 Tax=Bacillus gaemokensis TaxID=574375 RepID=UPI001F45811C|nr:hypothetical protein [Bacillus gaemokensis]